VISVERESRGGETVNRGESHGSAVTAMPGPAAGQVEEDSPSGRRGRNDRGVHGTATGQPTVTVAAGGEARWLGLPRESLEGPPAPDPGKSGGEPPPPKRFPVDPGIWRIPPPGRPATGNIPPSANPATRHGGHTRGGIRRFLSPGEVPRPT
jgi:hypothetical protein